MSHSLNEMSVEVKKSADYILRKTELLKIFSELGTIEFRGSYRLDVMLRHDIDFIITTHTIIDEKAFEITKKLIDSKLFHEVSFSDFQKYRKDNLFIGYYWSLTLFDKKEWRFDIWYEEVNSEGSKGGAEEIKNFENFLRSNPEKKLLILEIKYHFLEGQKYRANVSGIEIYRAVINKGIASLEEFENSRNK